MSKKSDGDDDDADADVLEGIQDLIRVNPEPLRKDVRFASSANSEIKSYLGHTLKDHEYFMFLNTYFGIYLNIPDSSHQGQIHWLIRGLQVQAPNDEELWIDVHGKLLKFTLLEFALVTGLKCDTNEEDFDFVGQPTCRIIKSYFPDRATVTKGALLDAFERRVFGNNKKDAVKMAILVFISNFLFSQTVDAVVDAKFLHFVDRGSYTDYPWGKAVFKNLMRCYSKPHHHKSNRMTGMSYVL